MKAHVKNFLFPSNIKDSKRFRKMVSDLMPDGVNEIKLWNYNMTRASGWGHYYRVLELEINGETKVIKKLISYAYEWDEWNDLEYCSQKYLNWVKRSVLDMLEEYQLDIQILVENQMDEVED
jgi:hypothetical protein